MVQVVELQQWQHHYYSLVRYFTVVGQAQWGARGLPTCDSVHSWRLYNAASLGYQATSTMTCYPTELHYLDTEPTSSCPVSLILSAGLGSDKYQF